MGRSNGFVVRAVRVVVMAIVFVVGERDRSVSFVGVAAGERGREERVGVRWIFWPAGAQAGEVDVRHHCEPSGTPQSDSSKF
jgi:hypothetical protein